MPTRKGPTKGYTMANITIEQFEKEALAFLESNSERRPVEKAFVWGEGSDNFYREKDRAQEAANAEEAKVWRQKKFDAGFGWITGPESFGGRALTPAYDRLYNQLEATFRVPDQSAFAISLGMVTPTILDHGSHTSRDLYVRKLWRQKKFDAGFGWITGPEAYGGRQLPPAYDRLYNQLEATFRVPDQSAFAISLGMVTPTILDHGSQTARDLYVRKLWRGEMIASQLFSDPVNWMRGPTALNALCAELAPQLQRHTSASS